MNKKPIIGVIFVLSIFNVVHTCAQCKTFTKKHCIPQVSPYIFNGQYNGDVFVPGGAAEMQMTFQKGLKYKILICHQEVIKKVRFKVLNTNRTVLFDSYEEGQNFFEFQVESTQDLIIQVFAMAQNNPNNIVPAGCVSLLVGFMKP